MCAYVCVCLCLSDPSLDRYKEAEHSTVSVSVFPSRTPLLRVIRAVKRAEMPMFVPGFEYLALFICIGVREGEMGRSGRG